MRMQFAAISTISAFVAFPVLADELFYSERAGESYYDIRTELIREGWIPAAVTEESDCFHRRNAAECLLFPEIEVCTQGAHYCRMKWVRGNEIRIVGTVGEDPYRIIAGTGN